MELDDLKQAWQRSNEQIKHTNGDIMDMIQSRNDGPAARLKRRFRRGMVIIPVLAAMALNKLLKKQDYIHILFTWYFIAFILVIMTYFFISYRQMNKLQMINGDVKSQLQYQVSLLRKGLKWRRFITRGLVLFYFLLLELLMYYRPDPSFHNWQGQPFLLRQTVYAGLYLVMYLITKYALNHRYKKHIKRLEELVEEM